MNPSNRNFVQLYVVAITLFPVVANLPDSWSIDIKILMFGVLVGWIMGISAVRTILFREEARKADKRQKQAYKDLFK